MMSRGRLLAVILLWAAAGSVVFLVYTNYIKGTKLEFVMYSQKRPHVNVALKREYKNNGQLFVESLKQVHLQLGEKRDAVTVFNDSIITKRKDRISAVCPLLMNDTREMHVYNMAYYKGQNILYCPVAKVASKFLTRMLHVMDNNDLISPFEFGMTSLHTLRDETKTMTEAKRNIYEKYVMDSTFKFMFSRDPYKRIFSSYIDKLVSPNSVYWAMGKRIISVTRDSPSNTSLRCGHDVKFSELVKFLLTENPKAYDPHFRPVSETCDVCRVKYDFIGKVESLKHDVMYIVNRSEKDILFKDFREENNVHFIIFNTKRTFSMIEDLSKCITKHVIYLRLWRQIQIAGLIQKHDNYPLTPEESSDANKTTIINLLLNAYHQSSSGARTNSKEAYLQAYSEVSLEDMEKLRLNYLKDFMLFDYEDRPNELFEKGKSGLDKPTSNFDYFDILPLES